MKGAHLPLAHNIMTHASDESRVKKLATSVSKLQRPLVYTTNKWADRIRKDVQPIDLHAFLLPV